MGLQTKGRTRIFIVSAINPSACHALFVKFTDDGSSGVIEDFFTGVVSSRFRRWGVFGDVD